MQFRLYKLKSLIHSSNRNSIILNSSSAMNPRQRTKKERERKKKWKSLQSNYTNTTDDCEKIATNRLGKQLSTKIHSPLEYTGDDLYMLIEDNSLRDPNKYDQKIVQRNAWCYRKDQYYGPGEEQRTCIWSGGDPFTWTEEKSSGISWIGVNGTDATLVVAKTSERKSMPSGWTQLPSVVFIVVPLCDMGDTTTASTEFRRQLVALSSPKNVGPFAVVSVAPGTPEDHLESTDRDRAVKFLQKKLKGRSALTFKEVKQIAVCALKFLLNLKFDPNMVEARYSGNAEGLQNGTKISAVEVQEDLAAINLT